MSIKFRPKIAADWTVSTFELAFDAVIGFDVSLHISRGRRHLLAKAAVPRRCCTAAFFGTTSSLQSFDVRIAWVTNDNPPRRTVGMLLRQMEFNILLLPVVIEAMVALEQLGTVHFQMTTEGFQRKLLVGGGTVRAQEEGSFV